jgi:hypothetical protein
MKFPVCELYAAEEGFYCQCVGCPIVSNSTPGCVLEELSDGDYQFVGPTPNGGVKAIFHFTNNEGEQVPKSDAIHVEIREYNDKGKVVGILYGMVDPEGSGDSTRLSNG